MHEIGELASAAWFEFRATKHVKKKTLARHLRDWSVPDADAIARQLQTKHVDLPTLKLKFRQMKTTQFVDTYLIETCGLSKEKSMNLYKALYKDAEHLYRLMASRKGRGDDGANMVLDAVRKWSSTQH